MRHIDANVLLDALADQGTTTRPASLALVERLRQGRERVAMTELVLSEVVFVLGAAAAGRLGRRDIRAALAPIISLDSIELPNKDLWHRSLQIMADHNVDIADAQIVALLENEQEREVYSLDSGFDRIPGITRLEA